MALANQCHYSWNAATQIWDLVTGCNSGNHCIQDPNNMMLIGEDGDSFFCRCVPDFGPPKTTMAKQATTNRKRRAK